MQGGSGISEHREEGDGITGWMMDREASVHPKENGRTAWVAAGLQLAVLTQLPLCEARGKAKHEWLLSVLFIMPFLRVSCSTCDDDLNFVPKAQVTDQVRLCLHRAVPL